MGATGGVAPTQFQAATEGFFKGVGQGQEIISNVGAMQAQQANISRSNAQTEAANIQNDIARQTQEAQIVTQNNQLKQQSIQSQIQTDKLDADNQVLDAIRSGDPARLTDAVSNPKTMLSAIELDKEVQAGFGKLKASGGLNPQQIAAFDAFNATKDIYKAGPLQDNYQQAAGAASSSIPFQQLKTASGLSTNELLEGMQIGQGTSGLGEARTQLIAPNGKTVMLDPGDPKQAEVLGAFFASRDKLQTAGRYSLPLNPKTSAAPVAAEAAPQPGTPVAPQGAPQAIPPSQVPQAGAAALPGQPPVQPQQNVNPNNVSPTGVPLQTSIPALGSLNSQTTSYGDSIIANATRNTQALMAQDPYRDLKTASAMGMEAAIKSADIAKHVQKDVADETKKSTAFNRMAVQLDSVIKRADKLGYEFGTSWLPDFMNDSGTPNTGLQAKGLVSKATRQGINDIEAQMASLAGSWKFAFLASEASLGEGKSSAQLGNTESEAEAIKATGPSLNRSRNQLLEVRDIMSSLGQEADDKSTMRRFLGSLGYDNAKIEGLIVEYKQAVPALILDPETGFFEANPAKVDNSPIKWLGDKLGFGAQLAQEALSIPTTLPKAAPTETPAAGSGTSAPFEPAKKENSSAFPQGAGNPGMRGVGYNATPSTLTDLKAIAETAATGGNIKQFQTGGSVPTKLDKATPDLVARVIGAESLPGKTPGSVNVNSVSPTGVKGAMQVTQATFNEMAKKGAEIPLTNREDPLQSVVSGTKYLNEQLKNYDGNVDLALAAYNAGPETVDAILKRTGLSKSRATIDKIADHLPIPKWAKPGTNPTLEYVKKITSRGRVGSEQERPKGGGFFDNFSVESLNPFSVATASAEEPTPSDQGPTDLGIVRPEEVPEKPGDTPEGNADVGAMPTQANQLDEEGQLLPVSAEAPPTGEFKLPQATQDAMTTTATAAKVPEMEVAPRGDVPPVSEISEALKVQEEYIKGIKPYEPIMNRAVKWLQESPVGQFLGEVKQTQGFQAATVYTNGLTMGFYDEGMNVLTSSLGMDGNLVQKEIRQSNKDFHAKSPKIALLAELGGAAHGYLAGGRLLRMLRGGAVVPKTIDAATTVAGTVRESMAVNAVQGGVAAAGNSEGDLGDRAIAGAGGAVIGGTIGAVIPGAAKIPVVGAPGVMGAGIGAIAGAATTGDAEGMLTGAGAGAAIGATGGIVTQLTPFAQKVLTQAVVKLNNHEGLRTVANLFRQIMSGETVAEAAHKLPADALLVSQFLKSVSPSTLKGIKQEMIKTARDNPQISAAMIDELGAISGEPAAWIKIMRQLGEYPETAAKINQLMQDRAAGRVSRVKDNLMDWEGMEQAATQLRGLVRIGQQEAKIGVQEATTEIYAKAKEAVPTFDSSKIKELLSTDAMKEATAVAKSEYTRPLPKGDKSSLITDTSEKVFQRVKSNPNASINDLLEEPKELPDNAFEILTRSYRHLRDEIIPNAKPGERKRLGDLERELREEMLHLNPEWGKAQAEYAAILSKTDVLRSTEMNMITDISDGKVQQTLPKLMSLAPTELNKVVTALEATNVFKAYPDTFVKAAKGYLLQKLKTATVEGKIPKNFIADSEEKNLTALLGKEEFDRVFGMVQAEGKAARTESALGVGSHTFSMGEAKKTLDQYAGKAGSPQEIAGSVVSGSKYFAAALAAKQFLKALKPKGDPAKIDALADTLVLKADKGIEVLRTYLKKQSLTKREIKRMEPYLQDILDVAKATRTGEVTGVQSEIDRQNPKYELPRATKIN